ncbi:uncharacterized protein LOC124410169 [Diprion similis]|uniref:uncharacterized protein LOC124410169 n=1 Tax=Diprion similis TaxID=362088 RepID=UPI001EF7763A|nr:uncharacterized protein LOC124410169 [Diprion similis]
MIACESEIAPHFKMEDKKTAIRLMRKDMFMATIDLKDSYFLIPVDKSSRKYLRFIYKNTLYEFNCMPFGLCTAPYVFTKLMKPIAQKLRSKGFVSVFYLDDILLFGQSAQDCRKNVRETRKLIEKTGLTLNMEKCVLEPSKEVKFLGFIFDSGKFCLKLPQGKRNQIYDLVMKFQTIGHCQIRKFAEFIGILVAASPAVRYGTLYTKNFEREKFLAVQKTNGNYDKNMKISDKLIPDLEWWTKNIGECVNPIREDHFEMEIFSDASLTGWGVACEGDRTHGFWNSQEREEHINYLELKAVFYGLKCFAKDKKSCEILLRIDNTTALSYINRMGSVQFPKLSNLSTEIWRWCEIRDLWIFASYISSRDNKEADEESRVKQNETEWELASWAYDQIESTFGKFDIDLFASNVNAKCKKFVSWHRDPEACAVDAFTIPWTNLYFYAFPPFSVILRTIRKIIAEKANGVLVAIPSVTNLAFPGCREIIGQAFALKGVPHESIPIKRVNPFQAPVGCVLEFLTVSLSHVKTHGTSNSYRSALALIVIGDIGQQPVIKRFFRGVAHLRPQSAKYDEIWDPDPVLCYLKTLWPHDTLSFEDLTKKLVMLLALVTAQRVQTLSKIRLSCIEKTDTEIKVKIIDRIKSSGPGKNQPLLCLPFFIKQPKLCVATVLDCYMKRSARLRPNNEDFLLLTYKKPHRVATTQAIRRWIKDVMAKSGIDTNTFGSHSTRHAVTSAAYRRGVDIETIRKAAG